MKLSEAVEFSMAFSGYLMFWNTSTLSGPSRPFESNTDRSIANVAAPTQAEQAISLQW